MQNNERAYRPALLLILCLTALAHPALAVTQSGPQIGGGTCSTGTVNGTYFYLLTGAVSSNGEAVPYAEIGKIVTDGAGNVSGQTYTSASGQQTSAGLSGTYSVQSNCAGSMTYTINSETVTLAFQVVANGQAIVVAVSSSNAVVVGTAYAVTAGTSPANCSNASLSGAYGYTLYGNVPGHFYSDAGQFVVDGNGNGTVASVANLGGTVSQSTGSGSYSVSSDCSGTATVSNSVGTLHYRFAVVQDGQKAIFYGSDPGWTISGVFAPQFGPPQNAVVNGASFQARAVAPGGLFSIFGSGLSAGTASAQSVPLPTTLAQTQVLVNGTPVPLVYASGTQINAQMPVGVPTGQPMTVTVTNSGQPSNSVALTVPTAAPGLFTNGSQAIVQNPNGSLNSSSTPAHPGDVIVAYLTGCGAVNSSAWTTGAASPPEPSSVTSSYSITVGNQAASVQYLGLTPGFVGLYQANLAVPSLASGTYPMVVTVAGNPSNQASITVAD